MSLFMLLINNAVRGRKVNATSEKDPDNRRVSLYHELLFQFPIIIFIVCRVGSLLSWLYGR